VLIDRIFRTTIVSCVLVAAAYAAAQRSWLAGASVMGGGLLISLSYWAIWSSVDLAMARRGDGESRSGSTRWVLMKFFTRHAIVAVAAYGMMVRLHLDPLGLLAGVSSLVIAVTVEVLREMRWRRFP
jgi:hypothetical protein